MGIRLKIFKKLLINNERWALIGDFNQVLNSSDKYSPSFHELEGSTKFRECLEVCSLMELEPSGQKFTWHNKREGLEEIWEG